MSGRLRCQVRPGPPAVSLVAFAWALLLLVTLKALLIRWAPRARAGHRRFRGFHRFFRFSPRQRWM
jgi:hypothetical protein